MGVAMMGPASIESSCRVDGPAPRAVGGRLIVVSYQVMVDWGGCGRGIIHSYAIHHGWGVVEGTQNLWNLEWFTLNKVAKILNI